MKMKKLVALCKRTGIFRLFDKIGEGGELLGQWMGDGYAAYPLNGIPVLDEETLCAVFDITEKQREKFSIRRVEMPETVNFDDTDPAERLITEDDVSIIYSGIEVKPLKTRSGIIFIQSKYLSPLEDVLEVTQLFERQTPDGLSYIVAKTGLLIAAVIFPYSVVDDRFVDRLEEITEACRRALNTQQNIRPAEQDTDQTQIF